MRKIDDGTICKYDFRKIVENEEYGRRSSDSLTTIYRSNPTSELPMVYNDEDKNTIFAGVPPGYEIVRHPVQFAGHLLRNDKDFI